MLYRSFSGSPAHALCAPFAHAPHDCGNPFRLIFSPFASRHPYRQGYARCAGQKQQKRSHRHDSERAQEHDDPDVAQNVRLRLPTCFAMPWNSLRMYPGEVVLKRLTAVGGKALPDVRRAGVLRQVPERKRRLPGAVRPRDDMAYRFRLFNHSFDIIPNPQRMRRAIWYNNINQRRDVK